MGIAGSRGTEWDFDFWHDIHVDGNCRMVRRVVGTKESPGSTICHDCVHFTVPAPYPTSSGAEVYVGEGLGFGGRSGNKLLISHDCMCM